MNIVNETKEKVRRIERKKVKRILSQCMILVTFEDKLCLVLLQLTYRFDMTVLRVPYMYMYVVFGLNEMETRC